MQYTPKDTSRRCDTLNLKINTVYDLPLDGELELNVTSKSNGQLGPGAIFSVTKRNVFGGGELSMSGCAVLMNGRQTRKSRCRQQFYNQQLGIRSEHNADIPTGPFPKTGKGDTKYPSSTSFRIYIDQLNRAKFFKIRHSEEVRLTISNLRQPASIP